MLNGSVGRLRVPIIATSLLLLVLGATSAFFVLQLQRKSARIAQRVTAQRAAQDLELSIREVRVSLTLSLLAEDQKGLSEVPALWREVASSLQRARDLTPDDEQDALDALGSPCQDFGPRLEQLAGQPPGPERAEKGRYLVEHLSKGPLTLAHELVESHERGVEQATEDNRDFARRAAVVVFGLGLGGGLAGLLGGLWLARSAGLAIIQLSVPISNVAGQLGQVVGPVSVSVGGDVGDLGEALRTIEERVAAVVQQLRLSQQQAQRTEQLASLGQLAAGIAHEALNPLMSIKLLVEGTLEEAPPQSAMAEDLGVIRRELDRLELTLKRFLHFARPPSQERQVTRVEEVIESTLALVGVRCRHQRVALQLTSAGACGPVEGDPGQLQQLVLNLCLNALDAMPAGGKLEVVVGPGPGGEVQVEVLDTGPGIAPEIQPRLFQPFASTKPTGMGLGLAVSRQIAEAHGGALEGSNRPEGGARFVLRLPPCAAPPPDTTDKPNGRSTPPGPDAARD